MATFYAQPIDDDGSEQGQPILVRANLSGFLRVVGPPSGSTADPIIVSDGWAPSIVSDVTDNDSDKTFAVPADTEYQLLSILVNLTSTAAVGNRQVVVLITDDDDVVLAEIPAGAVQAASLTRRYSFAVGNPDLTSFRDTDVLLTPLPVLILPAGYKIRVYDNAAIAAAADDMHVHMIVMANSV